MAEIRVERKEGKGWMWALLALIALAFLAWWYFSQNDIDVSVATTDSAAATYDIGTVPPAVTPDRGGVDDFLAWVANSDTTRAATTGDMSHEYTAAGIKQLGSAIASIARGDSLSGTGADEQVSALNTLADRLQTEPQSLKHANLAQSAFAAAAQLLEDMQRRSFPNASAQVGAVRQAVNGVSKTRPLLEQRAEIKRFFASAADAIRAFR